MAREQRKDVDYFPHDCTHGRKMHIIESKYGNDGYAVWFKLLEQLGKANNHFIDISDEMNLMFLTSVFKVDEEKTVLILNDLARLDAIDAILYKDYKVIYSQKFVDSVEDAYRNRKGDIIQYDVILSEIMAKNGQSSVRNPQTSVSLTEVIPKVKKSKEKESKEDKNIPEFSEFLDYALEKKPMVDNFSVRAKYDSWIENNWKDGNDNQIKNWKTKLTNTLPYLKEKQNGKITTTEEFKQLAYSIRGNNPNL